LIVIHVSDLFGSILYEAPHAEAAALHAGSEWRVETSAGQVSYPDVRAVAAAHPAFAHLDVLIGHNDEPLVKPFYQPPCRWRARHAAARQLIARRITH